MQGPPGPHTLPQLELISDYLIRVDWDPPTSRGQVNPLAPLRFDELRFFVVYQALTTKRSYQVAMLDANGTILSSTYTESTTIVQQVYECSCHDIAVQVLKSKGQSSLEIRVGAVSTSPCHTDGLDDCDRSPTSPRVCIRQHRYMSPCWPNKSTTTYPWSCIFQQHRSVRLVQTRT